METAQLGRLRDILEAARLITSYVAGTTEPARLADQLVGATAGLLVRGHQA